jgi:predicted RNA binding protein YcfA (HicA-like mRNA interferase family)
MADDLPSISGRQLMRLLRLDGWREIRRANHGIAFRKEFAGAPTRVTIVPDKRRPLAAGTLAEILGVKQTGLGRQGMRALIDKHGLK